MVPVLCLTAFVCLQRTVVPSTEIFSREVPSDDGSADVHYSPSVLLSVQGGAQISGDMGPSNDRDAAVEDWGKLDKALLKDYGRLRPDDGLVLPRRSAEGSYSEELGFAQLALRAPGDSSDEEGAVPEGEPEIESLQSLLLSCEKLQEGSHSSREFKEELSLNGVAVEGGWVTGRIEVFDVVRVAPLRLEGV